MTDKNVEACVIEFYLKCLCSLILESTFRPDTYPKSFDITVTSRPNKKALFWAVGVCTIAYVFDFEGTIIIQNVEKLKSFRSILNILVISWPTGAG